MGEFERQEWLTWFRTWSMVRGMELNVHEAKIYPSRLLERVALGEEVVIAKAGKAVAKLVPMDA
jgi:prevent-host-death family protein